MPSPRDVNEKATAESRSRGGHARAEKLREQRQAERQLRAEALDDGILRLARAVDKAAAAIEELVEAESEPVRLRAALAIFEILDAAELRELSDRLEHLAGSNGR
jgi:HEAT repeat protein